MGENLNRGRVTPGLDDVQPASVGNKPADMSYVNNIPKKIECPFGQDCRGCKIALNVNGKIECSISVIAIELLKGGMDTIKEAKNGNR